MEKYKKKEAEWQRALARDPKLKKAWEAYLKSEELKQEKEKNG